MTLDDILDELDDGETDAGLASDVSISGRSFNSFSEKRWAGVAKALAESTSGFKCIPEALLSNELLAEGMRHMNAKQSEVHASPDYLENYRQAALSRLESRTLFLSAFHRDLIDKRMIFMALEAGSLGPDSVFSSIKQSVLDDEVALACVALKRASALFSTPAAREFSKSTWVAAMQAEEKIFESLVFQQIQGTLSDVISDGYWPTSLVGRKPEDAQSAVKQRAKTRSDQIYKTQALNTLIKTFPIEEVLPLLKSASRKSLLSQIFTPDEMRPYMKQFPFLKAAVLESDLGM